MSVVEGDIVDIGQISYDYSSRFKINNLEDQAVLDHIESNLNSIIPSYEHTSILTENKSSICLPEFKLNDKIKIHSRNSHVQPDAIK